MKDVTLFLCGDVMTGRGIDQILSHPSAPKLYESGTSSARSYVEFAEAGTGRIPRAVHPAYIWGDTLSELDRRNPQARIINLETAVTTSEDALPGKGIHYRMHPENVASLTAARIDCCVLANNHVLDWGHAGLRETLDRLHAAGIRTAGAGRDDVEAAAPAAVDIPDGGRVLVFAFGCESAGVPKEWEAGKGRAGVNVLESLSNGAVDRVARQVSATKRAGDLVVLSIHWGGNWGYGIPSAHRRFAHRIVDSAGVDLVHGHSSHHPMGLEVYGGKLILYGCGDFLNDYEGIGGYEEFRSDLTAMYFPTLDAIAGNLSSLVMVPMQIRHFRVNRPDNADARFLEDLLNREAGLFGLALSKLPDGSLVLERGPD
jgi:poly-gamma-glutamate synthesis protein (capsule biosynthesis protein)